MPASATVFISWSGFLSQQVALVLRDWLLCVIQAVEPYVSSEEIGKGTRWTDDVATRLEHSRFGILCLTPDSLFETLFHHGSSQAGRVRTRKTRLRLATST